MQVVLSESNHAQALRRLRAVIDDPAIAMVRRVGAGFALGEALDAARRFDEAYPVFCEANMTFREMKRSAGEIFDGPRFQRYVDNMARFITRDSIKAAQRGQSQSTEPLFILGLPRSGTSLVEQILASHSEVFGTGESDGIGRISRDLAHRYAARSHPSEWDAEDLRREAESYLGMQRRLSGGTRWITDKMPDNVLNLHIMAMLFPRATVIHVIRDERDVRISNFFRFYRDGNLFSYGLADCTLRVEETRRLARHWQAALPIRIIEVAYEDIVASPEDRIRTLLTELDLTWEDTCLRFFETPRQTPSPNPNQITQKIYSRSVGRWKNYPMAA
jgi:Sulfotransferase family